MKKHLFICGLCRFLLGVPGFIMAAYFSPAWQRVVLCCWLFPGFIQARHYFCESLFWASQPKQAAKITWQSMPSAPRYVLRSCHCVKWLDGVSDVIPDPLWRYARRVPRITYAYRGLPALASLSMAGSRAIYWSIFTSLVIIFGYSTYYIEINTANSKLEFNFISTGHFFWSSAW